MKNSYDLKLVFYKATLIDQMTKYGTGLGIGIMSLAKEKPELVADLSMKDLEEIVNNTAEEMSKVFVDDLIQTNMTGKDFNA